jgi:hypothetical protein
MSWINDPKLSLVEIRDIRAGNYKLKKSDPELELAEALGKKTGNYGLATSIVLNRAVDDLKDFMNWWKQNQAIEKELK